jgi:hypothetical protein
MGKILVFVNFLFAVVTAGLIIMVFLTRTNWAKGFDDLKREVERERNNYLNLYEQKIEFEKAKKGETDKYVIELTDKTKELQLRLGELADAKKKVDEAEQRAQEATALVNKAKAIEEAMKVEIKSLDEQIKAERERVMNLGIKLKEYKGEAIKATTDAKAAQDRNEQLLAKLVEVNRKFQALEGETAGKLGREAPNPPPDDIYGRVVEVDDATGYVRINLGSDSGLNNGNTLEVYRLKPRAAYVGVLRIYDVRPNEAIGKLMGAGPRGRVQKDDEVASRILGTP